MRLDHVSYACTPGELVDVVQLLGSRVGAAFVDGGRHPRFGTRNFVLPLEGGTYLEIVAPLEHPATDEVPFCRAVRRRAEMGGGWLGWVVAVDDLGPVEFRLGRRSVEGHRVRPDGYDLRWHQLGVLDLIADPQLPFFIRWDVPASEHPSSPATDGVRLERIEICGDPAAVAAYLGEPEDHPLDGIAVDWVAGDEPGVVAVHLATAHGSVRLD
ncbi:MAG: VOC family protein [Candidatus Nanopelagicales bacterium]